jgi:hypothetical protein
VTLLGVVLWTDRDKRGIPVGGVRPLAELQKSEWRDVDAVDEFPSQGQVFWPNAQGAIQDSFVLFRAEPNPGHKDDYRVAEPKLALEVLDLRSVGSAAEVRSALAEGVRFPGQAVTARVLVWCEPDLLVGPVELTRNGQSTAKLTGTNLHKLAAYSGAQVRSIPVDGAERLLRLDESPPTSFVDWDEDAVVLRRGIEVAVRAASQAGGHPTLTKKQIEETAHLLISKGVVGTGAQLDRYRIEKALQLLQNSDAITQSADQIAALLQSHPAIAASLDKLKVEVRAEAEQAAREDLDLRLKAERSALTAATEAHAQTRARLETEEKALRDAERSLESIRTQVADAKHEAETAVNAAVAAALETPLALLAQASVLRPFIAGATGISKSAPIVEAATPLDWSRGRSEQIVDKASLRRIFTDAARARGIQPSAMLQIHAAMMARLMPVTWGPNSFAALAAYAQAVCGGRSLVVHVSPSAIAPRDLYDAAGRNGLTAAAEAARAVDGMSLVVLEGANRSALEASVLPVLQTSEVELSPICDARGLRLSASVVTGATTVPISSQIWRYGVAVCAEYEASDGKLPPAGDLKLSSDLLELGDEPTTVIDEVVDMWPEAKDLRPSMNRFGRALCRLYSDPARIRESLLNGLVLPYVATALSAEEQTEAASRAGDRDGSIATILRRFRRMLL